MGDVKQEIRSREPPDLDMIQKYQEYQGQARRLRALAQTMKADLRMVMSIVGESKGGAIHRKEYGRVIEGIEAAIARNETAARSAEAKAERVARMLPKDGVLYAYYVVGLTWEEVAYQKELSLRYVYTLRRKELENLSKNEARKGGGA